MALCSQSRSDFNNDSLRPADLLAAEPRPPVAFGVAGRPPDVQSVLARGFRIPDMPRTRSAVLDVLAFLLASLLGLSWAMWPGISQWLASG